MRLYRPNHEKVSNVWLELNFSHLKSCIFIPIHRYSSYEKNIPMGKNMIGIKNEWTVDGQMS